mgnify:CR=1 FL=1
MKFINAAAIFLQMVKKGKIEKIMTGYLILGYFRWQPWLEAGESVGKLMYSWDSWSIFLLPAMIVLCFRYVSWFWDENTLVRIGRNRKCTEYLLSGIVLISFLTAFVYEAAAVAGSLAFSAQTFQIGNQELLHLIFSWAVLAIYGLLFTIGCLSGVRIQTLTAGLVVLPAVDEMIFRFGGTGVLSSRLSVMNSLQQEIGTAVWFMASGLILVWILNQAVMKGGRGQKNGEEKRI